MRITDKINFRQPKYMLPAIVYIPLIATGYFVFDMFNTEVAETQDKNLQTTEFLNPNLPGAQIKNGDGIGGKYENMAKSYGRIADYSAVDNIERDNEEEKEARMIALLCNLSEQDLWLMTAADYSQLLDAFNVFMLPPAKRPKADSSGQ